MEKLKRVEFDKEIKATDFVEWISAAVAFRSINGGSLPYEKAYKAYLRRLKIK